jgi:hypothetical protein
MSCRQSDDGVMILGGTEHTRQTCAALEYFLGVFRVTACIKAQSMRSSYGGDALGHGTCGTAVTTPCSADVRRYNEAWIVPGTVLDGVSAVGMKS